MHGSPFSSLEKDIKANDANIGVAEFLQNSMKTDKCALTVACLHCFGVNVQEIVHWLLPFCFVLDCCSVFLGCLVFWLLLLLPCWTDVALHLHALVSWPLVHADCEENCGGCHLDYSPHLLGLSLLSVGCLVSGTEIFVVGQKNDFPVCPPPLCKGQVHPCQLTCLPLILVSTDKCLFECTQVSACCGPCEHSMSESPWAF